jgi:uncharacterized protein YjiK
MTFLKKCLQIPLVLAVFLFLVNGCKQRVRYLKSPPHYNFSQPAEHKLDKSLREISGITWDARRNEFICHNDELGKLFFYDRELKLINREVVFSDRKGDYEDVALIKGTPYVLRSDGLITKVITDSNGRTYGIEAGKIAISGDKDFETIYYDTTRKALVIICKNCALDDKGSVSAFAFYPDSIGFDNKPLFIIDADEVRRLAKSSKKFQPSAAAINPKTNQLFIVSSASNQLVVADYFGNVEAVYVLSKKMFPQPEGITFKNNGDMYISNEGVTGLGTIIRFSYIL